MSDLQALLGRIRSCAACAGLPLGPRPIVQADERAAILVAGQAPGRRAHERGIPFDDPSGDRLRDWMGIDRAVFYDPARIAIAPMGFCYPGTAARGDLPPRAECAPLWRDDLLDRLTNIRLTLVIGRHAVGWHLPGRRNGPLGDIVRAGEGLLPHLVVLPHPSPRNRGWIAANPWFETDLLPALRRRVADALTGR